MTTSSVLPPSVDKNSSLWWVTTKSYLVKIHEDIFLAGYSKILKCSVSNLPEHKASTELTTTLKKDIPITCGLEELKSFQYAGFCKCMNFWSSFGKFFWSLFYRYYFGRCSSVMAQLVHLFILEGGLLIILTLHDFSATIPRSYKDVYVNSFFPHTVRPWNSLPIECFPLTLWYCPLQYMFFETEKKDQFRWLRKCHSNFMFSSTNY